MSGDELPQLLFVMLLGIWIGNGCKVRWGKSTYERFGEAIRDNITAIYDGRKLVGPGVELSITHDLDMPNGRKFQIIVREAA